MSKDDLKLLIAQARLDEAVDELLELISKYSATSKPDKFVGKLSEVLISNSGKLRGLQHDKMLGIIDRQNELITIAQVQQAILHLLDELPAHFWNVQSPHTATTITGNGNEQTETDFWQTATNANSLSLFHEYLKKYPKGKFAYEAKQFIAVLKQQPPFRTIDRRKKLIYLLSPIVLIIIVLMVYFSTKNPDKQQISVLPNPGRGDTVKVETSKISQPNAYQTAINEKIKKDSIAKSENEDKILYQKTITQNTTEAYNIYLKKYPDGLYSKQAKQKIADLENEKLQKQIAADKAEKERKDSIDLIDRKDEYLYKNTLLQNTEEAFKEYLKFFPSGKYSKDANQKIANLEIEKRQKQIAADNAEKERKDSIALIDKKDEDFYKNALAQNRRETLKDYLKSFPSGKYSKAAKQKIADYGEQLVADNAAKEAGNPEMVFVKGGEFIMGDDNGYSWEEPAHKVVVSDFYIGKYEVTQKQWTDIMGSNPSYFKGCGNCPVEQVSWNDIQEFIKKLNQKIGKTYRLPTEAEWEYAAGGGANNRTKWAGTNIESELKNYAWYSSNSGSKTHPVGSTAKANSFGIYDMSGNVWEWCNDWYGADYYKISPLNNPQGPSSGSGRVLRGGSWHGNSVGSRMAYRYHITPGNDGYFIGFRLLLAL